MKKIFCVIFIGITILAGCTKEDKVEAAEIVEKKGTTDPEWVTVYLSSGVGEVRTFTAYRDSACIIAQKTGTKQAVLAWLNTGSPQEQIGDSFNRAVSSAFSLKKISLTDADKQAIGIFTNTLVKVIEDMKTFLQSKQQVFGDNWWVRNGDICTGYLLCPVPKAMFNGQVVYAYMDMEPATQKILNAILVDICQNGLALNCN
jgi:hypothetical protein